MTFVIIRFSKCPYFDTNVIFKQDFFPESQPES
jgi:hypothetical protein